MAAEYPTAVPTIASNKATGTTMGSDHPNHHNKLAQEIVALATELGTLAKGSAATVKARIAAVEAAAAAAASDAELAAVSASMLVVQRRNVTGSGRNLQLADFGCCLDHSAASNWTLTLLSEAGAAGAGFTIPEGAWLECLALGVNFMKVQGENGGMLLTPLSSTAVDAVFVTPQNGTAGFRKRLTGTDQWIVTGSHALA